MRQGAGVLIIFAVTVKAATALAQTDAPSGDAPASSETSPTLVEPRTDTEAPTPTRPNTAPPIPSFQRGSGTRAGGPANELNTGDERASEEPPGGSASEAVSGRDLYHGNYCGHGNRGPGLPPTDELDAACKRHDECYDAAQRRSWRRP